MIEIPPFVPFFIGALLVLFTGGRLRAAILLATPLIGAWLLWQTAPGLYGQLTILDFDLVIFRLDKLSLLFGYLFHLAAFIAVIYSLHVRDTLQQTSGLLYAGSALGAVFAGDLLTLFVFWELLALTSVFLVWARRHQRSYHAGMRYLAIHIASGLLLLLGTVFYLQRGNSPQFIEIGLNGVDGWLIFIAFGIKCGFPFLHNWLTDAYPESTPTGTVFLSVFTTKVAVYALCRAYPGTELLIYIGAVMTCFPIFFAVIENDLRRVLAYSLINQLGFMVVGIGVGTALALNGAVAHAFSDVIFKGLLFMSMGAVLQATGKINGSELGGLYKSMPKTTVLCMIGAASISAFPLFSGFVSKSMIMSAVLRNDYPWVWLALLFASAGVFHHAGIKIPYFAFFAHDSGIRTREAPVNMLIAMSIAAALCLAIGIFPQTLYQLLPFDTAYTPYDTTHVLAQLQLLFFSALAFVWLNLQKLYPPELPSVNLDAEWLYRKFLPRHINRAFDRITAFNNTARHMTLRTVRSISAVINVYARPSGALSRSWPTSRIVSWVTMLLALYLLLSFFWSTA